MGLMVPLIQVIRQSGFIHLCELRQIYEQFISILRANFTMHTDIQYTERSPLRLTIKGMSGRHIKQLLAFWLWLTLIIATAVLL